MCYGKSSYELRLLPNLLSSLVVVCLLEVMAYYSDCSSSRSSDYSDYSSYLSNPGHTYYLHTIPVIVDFSNSHTVLALLSSALTNNP